MEISPLAQLEVEKQIFTTSLSVLADQEMDMLIGLDMLRRHRVKKQNFDSSFIFFLSFFLSVCC